MAQGRTSSKSSESSSADAASIGAETKVRGRVTGEGDLVIEGELEGEITLKGNLFVAEGGAVVSEIDADDVSISGKLEGNVSARGAVRLAATSNVRGDVRASGGVSLDEGAQFAGRIDADFDLPSELR